jgi:hypothetical protein
MVTVVSIAAVTSIATRASSSILGCATRSGAIAIAMDTFG